MRFKQYINEIDMMNMLEMVYFLNEFNEESVNEAILKDILDKFKSILPKFGIKAHSSGKGLLQVLGSATKNVGKILYYAFKVSQDEDVDENKRKIKELAKSVKKEDVLDVLLRLDLLTLHAITGPIHILDALTGWHIAPNLQATAIKIDDRAKNVITNLKVLADTTIGETKVKMERALKQIKNTFKFSSQISTDVLKGI